MAIYRAETKSFSRGEGHNLVAALSYRAGIALTDTNELNPEATTHDYTRKRDVVHTEILLPKDLDRQLEQNGITLDFQSIADLVEKGETTLRGKMKKSARLGREWVLCGVPELSRAENIQLFQQFAKEQAEEQGVISMCFVHDPKAGNNTRSKSGAADATAKDERNIHAHIVLLTRKVQLTKNNTLKLGAKSDSELSNEERTDGKICAETGKTLVKGKGLVGNKQWIRDVRESWADMLNEKLLEKNVQPVSHKSYRELGLDILPMSHVGNDDYSQIRKLNNEQINERNESVIRAAANSIIAESNEQINESVRQIDRTKQRIGDTESVIDENAVRARDAASASAWATKRCENLPKVIGEITNKRERSLSANSWATERCENLPKVIDETKHRAELARKWIDYNSQRATDSESIAQGIHQSITERAKPAPSPFDTDYERAFFERKRRVDRAIRETDRKLDGAKFGDVQRANDVKHAVQELACRLLNRRKENIFDERQLTMLDDFAKSLGINEHQNVNLAIDKINTVETFKNNEQILYLLNYPSQEREHHKTATADFYRFIADIDQQRDKIVQVHQSKLGRSNTSKVTAQLLTVETYLAALTKYANNSDKTDESRSLAEQHINNTVRGTVKQYEIAYKGLNSLGDIKSAQKHANALESSLSILTTKYADKLTDSDIKRIDESLKVVSQEVENTKPIDQPSPF